MTSTLQTSPNYSQLDERPSENKHEKGRLIFCLILILLLATETLITGFLLLHFWQDIQRTAEAGRDGGYPIHCLSTDLTQTTDRNIASCDFFNEELTRSAQQRLLLDMQNSVLEAFGELNITKVFKPALHVGPKQELKQFQGVQLDGMATLYRVQWDNRMGHISQQGFMRVSPSGEIIVPQNGIYFVFSQVHFETHTGHALHFTQYLYKKTESYPRPVMLAKAVFTPCFSGRSGAQLYSSHQGALFRLQRGDRLSLYVLNISHVHLPQEDTYFGAFMIH